MSAETAALQPAGFEDFEPFLGWALPRQVERSDKKMARTFEEIKALYDFAMADDHLVKALRHCDQFPLAELPPDAARLRPVPSGAPGGGDFITKSITRRSRPRSAPTRKCGPGRERLAV